MAQGLQNERMLTGVTGLDELLGGGLLPGRTVLLKGSPGAGKTTLGLQMLVHGALDYEEPGILITFEQIPTQLYADMKGFGWELEDLDRRGLVKMMFVEPEEMLQQEGRQANRLLVNIADLVDEYAPRRVLIDSISHLSQVFTQEEARSQFMRFVVELKKMGLTPMLTAELTPDVGLMGLDAYLVDTVIHLDHQSTGVGGVDHRTIEIIKTRGFMHISGEHPIEIGPTGIVVYPHTYPAAVQELERGEPAAEPAAIEKIPSGVPGLDLMLGGGYRPDSSIVIAGLSGTFKTGVMAHFLTADPESPALWISYLQSAANLERIFSNFGIDLAAARREERLFILDLVPGREPLEKILIQAEEFIERRGIERVGVDSLNELVLGATGDTDQQEAVRWFVRRLRQMGVTSIYSQRLARVTGRNPLSEIAWAEHFDTIIYTGLVEINSRLQKVISVLKHLGGDVAGDLRSIDASAMGLRVSERFIGLSGVLEGTPLGHPKAQIEQIFQPLYFIRDFLQIAKDPELTKEKRSGVLDNLSGETTRLIDQLAAYFDQPQMKSTEERQQFTGSKQS